MEETLCSNEITEQMVVKVLDRLRGDKEAGAD